VPISYSAQSGWGFDRWRRDEVVDIAADRVERDAADWRPGGAVGRVAEHDAVGGAASFLKWRSPSRLHIEIPPSSSMYQNPGDGTPYP
jgi:hypothetical protein